MRKRRNICELIWDQKGIAAVEFALFIPLLFTLFLTGFEANRFLLVHQKADRVAYTVADVVTQSKSVTNSQLSMILTSASQIMEPFSFTSEGVVLVSSVYQPDGTDPPSVRWQYSGGGILPRPSQVGDVNDEAQLPGSMALNARDNVIVAEVFYRYQPLFSIGLFEAQDVYKSVLYKPRLGALTTPPT